MKPDEPQKPSVAFLGLGNMGSEICRNLMRAGAETTVWDISADTRDRFGAQGARVAADGRSAVSQADVIFLSLPGPREVREVVLGDSVGLARNARPGAVVFDLSTIDSATVRELAGECAGRGVSFIDCPVSGGVSRAASGTLTLMVGATEAEAAPHRWLLDAIGAEAHFAGKRGGGSTLKLVNNMVALSNLAVLSEAWAIAERNGIDATTLFDVLRHSSGASYMVDSRFSRLVTGNPDRSFSVALAVKDMELASKLDGAGDDAPMAAVALAAYHDAASVGLSEEDISAILRIRPTQRHTHPRHGG